MNIINKRFISILLLAPLVLSIALIPIQPKKASAAPTVTITSPTEGQSISGTNFTAAGTATPNTTVVLSSGGVGFAQTISDGSGNWSVATSLPAGNISLTAKAIQNPEYGYFPSTTDLGTFSVNRIRLSDNAINPGGGGWPLTGVPGSPIIAALSPLDSTAYSFNPFYPGIPPQKIDLGGPGFNTVNGSYPSTTTSSGDYNDEGTLYFSPNIDAKSLSVVDTTTNTWQQDITFGTGSTEITGARRSPDNKIYVSSSDKVYVVDPVSLAVINDFNIPCQSPGLFFSKEANYPYYFINCFSDNNLYKLNRSDNATVAAIDVGVINSFGTLSLDNKKIYVTSQIGSGSGDKIYVINNETNTLSGTIQLTAEALGAFPTPDGRYIYAATPAFTDPLVNNIDVIDLRTQTVVNNISTDESPMLVSYDNSEALVTTTQVSFVLGATASSNVVQKLAETGAIGISSTLLIGVIIAITSYLYLDFRAHKKPLRAEDPHVKYTFLHHIRVVSMPRLKYRVAVTFSLSKRTTYK